MRQIQPITTDERVEIPVKGTKGTLLLSVHVDSEGYPVVVAINSGNENVKTCVFTHDYHGNETRILDTSNQVMVTLTESVEQ